MKRFQAAAVAFSLVPVGAFAQAVALPAGDALQEVVVTAQRRSENLQDVPVAVTAFSATELEQAGVASTTDLGVVTPALTVVNQAGNLSRRELASELGMSERTLYRRLKSLKLMP